jgi:hypothetical protein
VVCLSIHKCGLPFQAVLFVPWSSMSDIDKIMFQAQQAFPDL